LQIRDVGDVRQPHTVIVLLSSNPVATLGNWQRAGLLAGSLAQVHLVDGEQGIPQRLIACKQGLLRTPSEHRSTSTPQPEMGAAAAAQALTDELSRRSARVSARSFRAAKGSGREMGSEWAGKGGALPTTPALAASTEAS
jgi:hypothetical protein